MTPTPAESTSALPGHQPGGARRSRGWYLVALAFLVATTAAVLVERLLRHTVREELRLQVSAAANRAATDLAFAVNHRFALLSGLHAFMEIHWNRPTVASQFEEFAHRLQTAVPGVRTLQWVQDGVIRQTYPTEGNETVIGYDLRTDPRPFIREDLARAERMTGTTLSGPTELVQGGLGVIGRRSVRDARGQTVGVVAIVLDLPPILEESGIVQDGPVALAAVAPVHGTFAGRPETVGHDPRMVSVPLPEGAWQVAAAPRAGWDAAVAQSMRPIRAVLGVLVGLVTLIAALLASRRATREGMRDARRRQEQAERLGRMFAVMPDGAVVTSIPESLILEVNEGAERMLGYRRGEVLGKPVSALGLWVDPGQRDEARGVIQREGIVQNFQTNFRAKDGRELDVLLSSCVLDVDGRPAWLTLFRDVTLQRQLEARLAHSEKLEAVGRLAGGVAHDFNNLITAISGYADMLRSSIPPGDPRRKDVEEILRASGRAAQLTQQLLAFGRRQLVQPRIVDLNALVREVTSLLGRLLGADIALIVDAGPEVVPVTIDPGQVEQLLVNLSVNARDAMPEGGRLHLGVRADDGHAILTVRDEGEGMSPEIQAQLFEPFFTTKAQGKGTGLGLATVYGIVQQAGGEIGVESAPGRGATFTIRLPLTPGDVTAEAVAGEPLALVAGVGTVLVAEDEPQVCRLVERTLLAAGYRVLTAPDGAQALAISRADARPIHLLITDVVMPGMGGRELAETFRRERPDSRVLFISGYTEDLVARRGLAEAGAAFLPKPFTPRELTDRVRSLLEPPNGTPA